MIGKMSSLFRLRDDVQSNSSPSRRHQSISCYGTVGVVFLVVLSGPKPAWSMAVDNQQVEPKTFYTHSTKVVQTPPNSMPKEKSPDEKQKAVDKVRRVTVGDLKELLKRKEVIVVDVRDEGSWQAGHIKGAKLVPGGQLIHRAHELNRDKLIIFYCSCPHERSAAFAALELERLGFKQTAALLGGFREAQRSGLPIESGTGQ